MKQIIKRLEIIKHCIAIEDDETVEFQTSKLAQLTVDNDVEEILNLIKNTDFQKVVPLIDSYIQKFTSLVPYEDKEVMGLKLELKVLEKQFLVYSCKVEEYHNLINDFNARYHKELGTLIEEILVLREEYYEFMYKNSKSFETEYLEAKKDFEDFHEELKKYHLDDPIELSKQEKKELKRLYKKASKLCHPDIIEDEKKEKAEEIFKELNAAYQHNDIKKISEILELLLTGESFTVTSDSLFDTQILKRKIKVTREKIKAIKIEIEAIKKNGTFILVNKIVDLDEYFERKREELLDEKESIMENMSEASQMV